MTKHSTRSVDAPPREIPDPASLRSDLRARRERIIDVAVELMREVDYDRIQVKDVADGAEVALGTLYRYFGSKDHLFACALLQWSSGYGERLERSTGASPLERVTSTYRRAVRAFEREPRVFDVLTQLQSAKDEHAATVFQEFSRTTTDAFESALADIPSPDREDIVAVMSAVLAEGLRGRQHGLLSFTQLQTRIQRTAELILG
ncbi:cholesterol catabolism transcriptional regulator KstR [soil metagenome]